MKSPYICPVHIWHYPADAHAQPLSWSRIHNAAPQYTVYVHTEMRASCASTCSDVELSSRSLVLRLSLGFDTPRLSAPCPWRQVVRKLFHAHNPN
eukprot:SAG11_NODE_2047_length_3884_cov_1.573844_2_plen_95_part_00